MHVHNRSRSQSWREAVPLVKPRHVGREAVNVREEARLIPQASRLGRHVIGAVPRDVHLKIKRCRWAGLASLARYLPLGRQRTFDSEPKSLQKPHRSLAAAEPNVRVERHFIREAIGKPECVLCGEFLPAKDYEKPFRLYPGAVLASLVSHVARSAERSRRAVSPGMSLRTAKVIWSGLPLAAGVTVTGCRWE